STGWTDKTSPECRRATCRSASSSSAGSELTSPVANEVEASTCSSRRDSSDAGGSPSTCRAGRRSGSRPPCEPDADAMRVISGVLARVAKQQHDQRQQRGFESEAGVGDPPKPDVLAHDGGRPFQLFLLLEQALEDALHERLGRLGPPGPREIAAAEQQRLAARTPLGIVGEAFDQDAVEPRLEVAANLAQQ